MLTYKCKYCGKKGTKGELRGHGCTKGQMRWAFVEEDNSNFLASLILLDLVSHDLATPEVEISNPPPSLDPGGGEFGGGGASSDYDTSSSVSESSFDSGGDSGGCDCGGGD